MANNLTERQISNNNNLTKFVRPYLDNPAAARQISHDFTSQLLHAYSQQISLEFYTNAPSSRGIITFIFKTGYLTDWNDKSFKSLYTLP